MGLSSIDGLDFVKMVQAGTSLLEKNKSKVDALNVFPVPDGDTGTNMYLTLLSASREAEKKQEKSIGNVAKAVSMGSLMGARGNSGVILSQVFRGIAKEIDHQDTMDAKRLAAALKSGSDTAYKAVMKPVEGTILTVVREVARSAMAASNKSEDIVEIMQSALEDGRRTLEKTPQLLPILKEAGVVDAGGQGFLFLWEGMIMALSAELVTSSLVVEAFKPVAEIDSPADSLEFRYCTETLIQGSRLDIERIREQLDPMGDSMLVVGEANLVKVHIHSNNPGKVLETLLPWGSLHDIKINNMEDEAREKLANEIEVKTTGLVAVSQGEGWSQIFSSLGVDKIVDGGQTMNPSTEDIIKAVAEVNAGGVIILPNNKNIIMAAEQAGKMADKPVRVIPTTSVAQAIPALVAYETDIELEQIFETMNREIKRIKTGEVTMAVKDSSINGLQIREGEFIGLVDDEILVKGDNTSEIVILLLNQLADEGDLISIYYGEEVKEEEANLLKKEVEAQFPNYDVELTRGGQPFYPYLISVE